MSRRRLVSEDMVENFGRHRGAGRFSNEGRGNYKYHRNEDEGDRIRHINPRDERGDLVAKSSDLN